MTPEFAAPEQVRGEPVSTATDVYALGVLLYLLLTGEHPYDLRGKSLAELTRIVCEEVPPAPSTRAPEPVAARAPRRSRPDRADRAAEGTRAALPVARRARRRPAALPRAGARSSRGPTRRATGWRSSPAGTAARRGGGRGAGRCCSPAGSARERGAPAARGDSRRGRPRRWATGSSASSTWPTRCARSGGTAETSPRAPCSSRARAGSTRVSPAQPEVQAQLRGVFGRAYTNLGLYDQATALLQQALAQHTALYGEQTSPWPTTWSGWATR